MTGGSKGDGAESRPAPRTSGRFDGFSLASRGAVIEGNVDAAELSRVNDLLAPEANVVDVSYRIAGATDAAARPALEVAIEGSVPLTCQRCLQLFLFPVEQRTLLLLAHSEQDLARLDEEDHEHEVVLAETPLDPIELVEDELLLTLPFAPRCPDDVCSALNGDQAALSRAPAVMPSAFDALAGLKSGPGTTRSDESKN